MRFVIIWALQQGADVGSSRPQAVRRGLVHTRSRSRRIPACKTRPFTKENSTVRFQNLSNRVIAGQVGGPSTSNHLGRAKYYCRKIGPFTEGKFDGEISKLHKPSVRWQGPGMRFEIIWPPQQPTGVGSGRSHALGRGLLDIGSRSRQMPLPQNQPIYKGKFDGQISKQPKQTDSWTGPGM